MRVLWTMLFLAAVAPAAAQDDMRVWKAKPGRPAPEKMLYEYLRVEAGKFFDARRKEVAALQTPEEIAKRQARLKADFLAAIGGLSDRTPLNARVVGAIDRGDFRVEKVIYESRPDHHVTANLYLPKGKGPFPGVLIPCGHSANGKAAVPYQRAAVLLAKNGMAALCYDPIGQGERLQLLDDMGKPAVPGSTVEHTMIGVGALLVGQSAATYRIWDGIRGLDYLASRPEIDAAKLGCTGNSGGGTMTAYLMALDDRIVAAAPSCYITTLERLFETIGPQDAEQNITGQVAFGMEHADYVTMRAPQPTLICVATRDYFDIDGAWKTFREAKLLYGKLGHGERVSLFEYDDTHGFSKPRREAAMRWMRRWLLGKDDAPTEGEWEDFTDEQLQCTRTGQVLSDLRGVSAYDLNALRAKELVARRAAWQQGHTDDELRDKVRELIALPKPGAVRGRSEPTGVIRREGYAVAKSLLETEPGILVPSLTFLPATPNADAPYHVYVGDEGLAKAAEPGGLCDTLAKGGHRVLALDLRGLGETSPRRTRGLADHFGAEWQEAFLALHLDRPLLGQRVVDLLTAIDRIAPQGKGGIHLTGVGTCGPIALHAAALQPRITKVTVAKSIPGWTEVARTPVTRNQLANAVPGALEFYDLPDLIRLIGADRVTVRDPVDALGASHK